MASPLPTSVTTSFIDRFLPNKSPSYYADQLKEIPQQILESQKSFQQSLAQFIDGFTHNQNIAAVFKNFQDLTKKFNTQLADIQKIMTDSLFTLKFFEITLSASQKLVDSSHSTFFSEAPIDTSHSVSNPAPLSIDRSQNPLCYAKLFQQTPQKLRSLQEIFQRELASLSLALEGDTPVTERSLVHLRRLCYQQQKEVQKTLHESVAVYKTFFSALQIFLKTSHIANRRHLESLSFTLLQLAYPSIRLSENDVPLLCMFNDRPPQLVRIGFYDPDQFEIIVQLKNGDSLVVKKKQLIYPAKKGEAVLIKSAKNHGDGYAHYYPVVVEQLLREKNSNRRLIKTDPKSHPFFRNQQFVEVASLEDMLPMKEDVLRQLFVNLASSRDLRDSEFILGKPSNYF